MAWVMLNLLGRDPLHAYPNKEKQVMDASKQNEKRLKRFENQVEELRKLLKIPGMSAVIIKDQKVLWGERLFVNIPANSRSEVFAVSESEFFLKIRLLQMKFIKNEEQVTHIEFEEYGQVVRAEKINYAGDV